ncbi:hypothetical protein N7527_009321 [Penicillium freii]|uniref:Uncharacterized protein n=1 Tax=Penicillium freii TaxID=48697 RepID=A0A101M9X8_PENFR|nr:hypothetical protein N7527_009321 [Penicillium freii]KUM56684.1 hypothetical protein ACN42_g10522 [Penicillium freii]
MDRVPSHIPLTTLPPPPGTTEATPTGLKDREIPMTPSPAQHAAVTTTELQDGVLEEGEIENPPTPHYPGLPSVGIKDEESLSAEIALHATTKVESGELNEEDIQSTPPSPPYSIISSIELEDEDILSTILTTKHATF